MSNSFRISILILVPALLAAPFLKQYYLESRAQRQFDSATSDSVILGKSVDQVIGMLGKPVSPREGKDSNGTESITFSGKYGMYCRIDFENGVATRTYRWKR